MNKPFRLLLSLLAGIICLPGLLWAQSKTDLKKAQYIFEIPIYLEWEFDEYIENLKVGFYGSNPGVYKELQRLSKEGYPNGTFITLIPFEEISDIVKTHVIYVSPSANNKMLDIIDATKLNNTLLITDSYNSKKNTMINLRPPDSNGLIIFEVNTDNVDNAGIRIDEKMYALGGLEIDRRDLVEETEEQLVNEKEKVEKQSREIQQQQNLINQQVSRIKEQQDDIEKQQAAIVEQQEQIDLQRSELATLLEQVDEQQRILAEKTLVLEKQEANIVIQEKKLEDQKKAVAEQNKILEKQNEGIRIQEERMQEQRAEMSRMNLVIETQKNLLLIFAIFISIVLILIFFIYRSYKIKQRVNRELATKNDEINKQKEEIQRQNMYTEAINKQLEKLSIVARETQSAITILNTDGTLEWVNVGFTRMYGYTLQLWAHEKDPNILKSDENKDIENIIATCLKTKDSRIYESKIEKRKGGFIYVQRTLTPILNERNEVSKLVLVDSDISDIKEAERAIREQHQQITLQAQELELKNTELAKLSMVASKTDNSVIIFDKNGEIEWVNDGFTRLLGVTLQEFKNRYGSNLIKSSLNDNIKDAVKKSIEQKKSVVYTSQTITRNKKVLWIQTTLTPIFTDDGDFDKFIAIDSDVTKIKLAEHEIAKQKQHITDSIMYARRIQRALLPPDELLQHYLPQHFVMYHPKDIVSGDFYWTRQIGNKVAITAADSTGHGVPGAFMSMLGITMLNDIVGTENMPNADVILNQLRERVKKALRQTGKRSEQQDGMDMALCVIDTETNMMQFAGANNPVLVIRNKQLNETKGDWMPIGVFIREKPFTRHDIELQDNDMVYIFSDGYVDQFGGDKGKKFMSKRFKELLLQINGLSVADQLTALETAFSDWKMDYKQMDDILVIGFRYQSGRPVS